MLAGTAKATWVIGTPAVPWYCWYTGWAPTAVANETVSASGSTPAEAGTVHGEGSVMVNVVPAGPEVGALLRAVRQWWMEGGCLGDRAACLAELARGANLPKIM